MRFIIPVVLLGISALCLAAPEALEGQQAPSFSLKDVNGKSISMESYRGKYVLLNFWASW
jgi:hypothetical protein